MADVTVTQNDMDAAWCKFEMWFFRECNEGTRRHLFALFGLPLDEIHNEGVARRALRLIRAALSQPAVDREALVERVAVELFRPVAEKAVELLKMVAGEGGSMEGDDGRLDPFCDDMPAGNDTINLCFNAGYLEQRQYGDDDFYIVLLDKGRAALSVVEQHLKPQAAAEPVAWMYEHPEGHRDISKYRDVRSYDRWLETPLYAHPPADLTAKADAMAEALDGVSRWLGSVVECDMDEIVADGGITAAMVVRQEAAEQQRRARAALDRYRSET